MKINVGPVELYVKKTKKKSDTSLSLYDIKSLNDDTVAYLKLIPRDTLTERVRQVAFENLDDVDSVYDAIDKFGIAIFPNLFSKESISVAEEAIESIKNDVNSFKESKDDVKEISKVLMQKGNAKLSGYSELSGYGKTVVQIREGQDEGMVDIFNIDFAYPELAVLREAYEKSNLLNVISKNSESMEFKNLNFYLNESITATRGFHADSYTPQLKAFIYLTDCLELEDGPYTYVKGSHKDSAYRRFNQAASENLPNKTETPFVKQEDIIPVLAEKGSLVISDQSGFHRGFPQSEGHSRAISVMNIK